MYPNPAPRKKYKIVKTHAGNAIIARYDTGHPKKLWVLLANGKLLPSDRIENHGLAHFLASTQKEQCIIDATFKEALKEAKKILGMTATKDIQG